MNEDKPEGVDSQDLDTQPTITTVFRLLQDMDGRLRDMEVKLQQMDDKLQRMDGKLQDMDARLNSLEATMQAGFDRLDDRITARRTMKDCSVESAE